jgi:hypothetical protein
MENTISFILKDREAINAFFKKCLLVDREVLLELQSDFSLVAKTLIPGRSALKFVRLNATDVFEIIGAESLPEGIIYCGIKNIEVFISLILGFNNDRFVRINLIYSNDSDNEYVTRKILLSDGDEKQIQVNCPPLHQFYKISLEQMTQEFDLSTAFLKFSITSTQLKEIINDTKQNLFTAMEIVPVVQDNNIIVSVKTKDYCYNLPLEEIDTKRVHSIFISRYGLQVMDLQEDYNVFVADDKVIFISLDTETMVGIDTVMPDLDTD